MKILLLNAQYGLGMNGSIKEYCLHFYRYLYCPKKVHQSNCLKIRKLILREKPDVVFLMEANSKLLSHVLSNNKSFVSMENKYKEKGLLSKLPIFKHKNHAMITNKKIEFKKHYLKSGMKRLVYELNFENELSVFAMHFDLSKRARKKQMAELKTLIGNRKKVIICGDFNIFKGVMELDLLVKDEFLSLINTEGDKTFPAHKPKKSLDLFLCSKDMVVKNFKVLKDKVSDHLPVLLEI